MISQAWEDLSFNVWSDSKAISAAKKMVGNSKIRNVKIDGSKVSYQQLTWTGESDLIVVTDDE